MAATTEEFKVKLVSAVEYNSKNDTRKYVTFDVTPTISESGSVDYEAIQILQGPTAFQAYRGTPARTFEMSDVKLISRTPTEARNNIERINQLRAWRMPYFGQTEVSATDIQSLFSEVRTSGTATVSPFRRLNSAAQTLKIRLGAPPEILYFSAYTQSSGTFTNINSNRYRGNIKRVPVVLTNLSITYPPDVAYIPTLKHGNTDALGNVPFPTIMSISISLVEAHSPGETNKFNLAKYASGVLDGF